MKVIYPECEKLQETANVHTTLNEFTEWLADSGYEIKLFQSNRHVIVSDLIYTFMEVDKKKLEIERRKILESIKKITL